MKYIGAMLILACAGVAGSAPAQADEPKVDGRTLGITEALLNHCGSIDPAAAERYRKQIRLLVQGASEAALAEVRRSEGYRKGRGSMEDFISKVDERNGKRLCAESVTPKK